MCESGEDDEFSMIAKYICMQIIRLLVGAKKASALLCVCVCVHI